MNVLNVNTEAAVKFTNTLEKMHKSALPNAVRDTLSKAALDVKKTTMPHEASIDFENRSPNFFRANSKVEFASGFNMDTMKSTVGFVSDNLRGGGNNYAVKDLEEQEHGGAIDKKSFIPMDPSRSGSNQKKMVRPNARLKQLRIVHAVRARGVNDRQKFVKSVMHAGKGGFVLAKWKEKEILWRVNSINRNLIDGSFKLTPVYSFQQSRKAHVSATNFMRHASLKSAGKMENIFIEQARRQIARFANR